LGALIVIGVSAVTLAVTAVIYLPTRGLPVAADQTQAFTRAEFITIVLTAVTVVLAALGLILASLAVLGFTQIQRSANETAERIAREVASTTAAREARAAIGATEADDLESLTKALTNGSQPK